LSSTFEKLSRDLFAWTGEAEAKMVHFTAIAPAIVVRPACSKCGARMWLTRIEPDKPGCNRRSFECSRCEYGMTEVVESEKVA
jgi:hypothetical protein